MIKKTPIRIQVNPIECGAVVLAIILGYYKHNITMHQLNNLVGVSRFGTDARALMRALGFLGFKSYAQKILVSDLKKTRALSVLFVDNSHFVVFEGYFWGRFFINDPALGRYSLSAEQLRRRLSGVQIVIEPRAQLLKNPKSDLSQKFMGGLGLILGAMMGLLLLVFTSNLVLSMSEYIKYLSLMSFFLLILSLLYAWFFKIAHLKLTSSYAQTLSSWLLQNIIQSGSGFFTTRPFASFARTLKNMNTLYNINAPMRFLSTATSAMIFVIILGIALIYWPFALIALALCMARLVLGLQKSSPRDLGRQDFFQAFEHYPDLAAMGQNQELINQQIAFTQRAYSSHKLSRKLYFSFIPLWLALPMIFYWGSESIAQGRLTTMEIYAVIILIILLSFLSGLLAKNLSAPKEEQDLALISEIGDLALFTYNKTPIINSTHLLEVENAYFVYPGEITPVLKDFNLVLDRAKIYAIKAPPMAGVSTLLKILGQKLTWTKGEQKLERPDMRIALIDDEADLFEGSLLENIRLFDRNINEDQVVEALKQACALEIFYQRPMGLLALIYSGGANVSGGQKKRLLLARALVHKPDLIILDDFFETLEPELALRILKNLGALGQSVIFSSQRLEEQELADKIIYWELEP